MSTAERRFTVAVVGATGAVGETMLAILADLGERHGGTRAWLRSRGWSGGDVEQLRARLVD